MQVELAMLGARSQVDHLEALETDGSRTGPEIRVKTGAFCQRYRSYQRLLRLYQNDSGVT